MNNHPHTSTPSTPLYIGRFAPSPTGRLHFGSLVAAVASYVDAKAHQGQWLVRIEDLDPPREVPGAASDILHTLEAFKLQWDGEVMYQSQRSERYQSIIQQLQEQQLLYGCNCTRKQIRQSGGVYLNVCRNQQWPITNDSAIRVKQSQHPPEFIDPIMGPLQESPEKQREDFIVRRRDGLFAYQLAVVCDDIDQNISCVVRGADLLDSTPKQLRLFQLLNQTAPEYLHIPLAVNQQGDKLSKQNYAPAIQPEQAQEQLFQALRFLGHCPPSEFKSESCEQTLSWAIEHWQRQSIPRTLTINIDSTRLESS